MTTKWLYSENLLRDDNASMNVYLQKFKQTEWMQSNVPIVMGRRSFRRSCLENLKIFVRVGKYSLADYI